MGPGSGSFLFTLNRRQLDNHDPSSSYLSHSTEPRTLYDVQAKHFLVKTEDNKDKDNKENLDAEDRLKDLLTEKQVNKVISAFPDPRNAELIYKSLNKSAQHAIQKKLHQAYGGDENAVRLPLVS